MKRPNKLTPETPFAKGLSAVMLVALGATGLSSCSGPEKNYCYIGTVGSERAIEPGIRADLLDEIASNFKINKEQVDLSNLHGATVAGLKINAVLVEMHAKDGDGSVPLGSIDDGDKYPYCISSDGEITAGEHGYKITNPR